VNSDQPPSTCRTCGKDFRLGDVIFEIATGTLNDGAFVASDHSLLASAREQRNARSRCARKRDMRANNLMSAYERDFF
jgi:hypothetical protein